MPTFSRLPPKLVTAVVEAVYMPPAPRHCQCACCGCVPYDKSGKRRKDTDDEHVDTLASLSLTSRQLNAIATWRLYIRPRCAKWWLLARTLIRRPDLAQHVKQLGISHMKDPGVRGSGTRGKQPRHQYGSPDSISSENGNDVIDLLSSLCPNAESTMRGRHPLLNSRILAARGTTSKPSVAARGVAFSYAFLGDSSDEEDGSSDENPPSDED
ncbi:hypothetical protein B0T17DRAFT_617557 [Bombardia bombarda]|uniref:Uncharacterized protein n=1 Tax=Bombardia bombarda TaxID=252184 RepID=A0AA39X1B9_9PEZI|nr:hypothetical protein B0T17DRAFT_617557 [Bombardia bombarda]